MCAVSNAASGGTVTDIKSASCWSEIPSLQKKNDAVLQQRLQCKSKQSKIFVDLSTSGQEDETQRLTRERTTMMMMGENTTIHQPSSNNNDVAVNDIDLVVVVPEKT